MDFQANLLRITFAACPTAKGLFAGVYTNMDLHVALVGEGFVAILASGKIKEHINKFIVISRFGICLIFLFNFKFSDL